jgi:hypothetical protein
VRIDRVTSKPLLLACCAGLALFLASCADASRSPTQPSHPAADAPATPPPVAKLDVHGEIPDDASKIFEGWETTFDASESTGDHVSFVIAYGDGSSTKAAVSRHTFAAPQGTITATATVTDQYGRSDTATNSFFVWDLTDAPTGAFIRLDVTDLHFVGPSLHFLEQHGSEVTGLYSDETPTAGLFPKARTSFTGTLSGTNAIRIHLDDGSAEFSGTYSLEQRHPAKFSEWLLLTAQGGALDGASIEFNYYDPY